MSNRRAIDEAKKGSAEVVILADRRARKPPRLRDRQADRAAVRRQPPFTLASLYATLYRMEDRGWIKGRWVEKAGQRRRCYYRITEAGRKVLAEQRADWSGSSPRSARSPESGTA